MGRGPKIAAGVGKAAGRGEAQGAPAAIVEGPALELANRGRSFKGGDTAAAEKGKAEKGARTREKVLKGAWMLLNLDKAPQFRLSDNRINISALAKAVTQAQLLGVSIGVERARQILRKAIEDGDLV